MAEEGFGVLSSPTRLEIYRLLLRNPMSTADLSNELGLSMSTLRFHLKDLEGSGLLVRKAEHPRTRGRPRILWSVKRSAHIKGFPERRYEELSQLLLSTLMRMVGDREEVQKTLFETGRELGKEAIQQIGRTRRISKWGPVEFCEYFIKGNLEAAGAISQVEKCGESEVVFSHFNCPFEEVARQYKEEICEHLDRGFYQGIAEGMGGEPTFERLSCIAHGDDRCTYVLSWSKDSNSGGGEAVVAPSPT